jgi:hypothetical protein
MVRPILAPLLLLAACAHPSEPPRPPAAAADAGTSALADPEAAYRCAADGDCLATCAYGALSRAYVEQNRIVDDCDDGCAGWGRVARCGGGRCQTTNGPGGGLDDACTHRPVPGPLAAYACAADADCVVDCAQGAVSRAWLERNQGQVEQCKDGCAETTTTRCVDGACAAFRGEARTSDCAHRPIRWR